MRTNKALIVFVLGLALLGTALGQIDCKGGKVYDTASGMCVNECPALSNLNLEGNACEEGCDTEGFEELVDGKC